MTGLFTSIDANYSKQLYNIFFPIYLFEHFQINIFLKS